VARRRFEWDERKRRENLRKHGIDFAEARRAFDAPALVDYDQGHSNEEDRYRMLGLLDDRVVVVIYTERGGSIRLISVRFATPSETLLYMEEFFGEPYERS
jgi:uncharacterized DUF497 family protein